MKKIIKTEKKYWVSGHHVRGKDFHTFAAKFQSIGLLVSFSLSLKYLSINLYKLV